MAAATARGTLLDHRRRGDGLRRRDPRLASLTLLAAQSDFTEAGELPSSSTRAVSFLEDMMWEQAISIPRRWPAPSSPALQRSDLVALTRDYLMGERSTPNDLMVWNADATTRMPYRCISGISALAVPENRLALKGITFVDGAAIALSDIRIPVRGRDRPTMSPRRSVHKVHLLSTPTWPSR